MHGSRRGARADHFVVREHAGRWRPPSKKFASAWGSRASDIGRIKPSGAPLRRCLRYSRWSPSSPTNTLAGVWTLSDERPGTTKRDPTFSDALAVVRRELWASTGFFAVLCADRHGKSPTGAHGTPDRCGLLCGLMAKVQLLGARRGISMGVTSLAGLHPTSTLPARLMTDPIWRRVARLRRPLGRTPPFRCTARVDNVWLEFDVDGAPPVIPIPSVFFAPQPSGQEGARGVAYKPNLGWIHTYNQDGDTASLRQRIGSSETRDVI